MFYRVHSINGKGLTDDVNKNCLDFPRLNILGITYINATLIKLNHQRL